MNDGVFYRGMCNLLVQILQIERVFGGTDTISTHGHIKMLLFSRSRSNVSIMYVLELYRV